jgi:hypothetical protein
MSNEEEILRTCLFFGVAFPVRSASVAHYWRGATSAAVWELALVVQTQPRKDKAKTRPSIPTALR